LLPQYRGAAPINWAIINGDKETGVTTFFLKHEIDTGDVIYRDVIAIDENDNAGTLHDKLMLQGGETVLRTVQAIVSGDVKAVAQDTMFVTEQDLRPAPKIFRDTCRIDWERDVCGVYDFVRGMSPYPAAWIELYDAEGKTVTIKVYSVAKEFSEHNFEIGTLLTDNKSYVKVAVSYGYISLLDVQLAGKKRMPIADMLRGFSIDGLKISK
jgi:methionyl-tRNA formyltransferase